MEGRGGRLGGVEEEEEVEASQPTWDNGPQLITNHHTLIREAFCIFLFFCQKIWKLKHFYILLGGRGGEGHIKKAKKLAANAFL